MAFFELDNEYDSGVDIRIFGVGGGGNNALNHMITSNVKGIEFIAVNTDRQALAKCGVAKKICIGERGSTKGNGAGADPEKGALAAEESADEIKAAMEGADMIFVAAGMGGGTGTGAAPVVARLAKEMGILTVGIVTKPFKFEGAVKMSRAEGGIAELAKHVDSLVIIPNERLKETCQEKMTLLNAFKIVDDILKRGVQSISDTINIPGYINLDFADITAIMKDAGLAHMGIGEASGENKAVEAAKKAIASPLLETSIEGATGVLINFMIGTDVSLDETNEAGALFADAAAPNANIIWGVGVDETLEDTIRITIIATGFEKKKVRFIDPKEEIKVGSISKKSANVPAGTTEIKIPAPSQRTTRKYDDSSFDDLFSMVNKSRKKEENDPFEDTY
ncbi:MAG: cell division protein FtsZ [Clostridia bacterium]|nr:cell division protein FtsZ [Clostridia bacterium]